MKSKTSQQKKTQPVKGRTVNHRKTSVDPIKTTDQVVGSTIDLYGPSVVGVQPVAPLAWPTPPLVDV